MVKLKAMAFDKDQQRALKSAGYQQSTSDSNKWINQSNNHWAKSTGDSHIKSTDAHRNYGSGQSLTDFKKGI